MPSTRCTYPSTAPLRAPRTPPWTTRLSLCSGVREAQSWWVHRRAFSSADAMSLISYSQAYDRLIWLNCKSVTFKHLDHMPPLPIGLHQKQVYSVVVTLLGCTICDGRMLVKVEPPQLIFKCSSSFCFLICVNAWKYDYSKISVLRGRRWYYVPYYTATTSCINLTLHCFIHRW